MWILAILAHNLAVVLITEPLLGFIAGARLLKKILTVMLVNVITNPVVVLTVLSLTVFCSKLQPTGLFILEILAVFSEGFMFLRFKTFDQKNPYLISLALNCASFAAGKLINIL
jgi:hypothetical protein